MKTLNLSLLVCALLVSFSALGASSVTNTELGQVIAVKRTFKLDLADCGRSYSVSTPGVYGACAVKVGDVSDDAWENLITGYYNKSTFDLLGGKKISVEITARSRGYIVMVNRDGAGEMDFISVRGYIQDAMEQIRGEVPITLQVIKSN